MIRAVHGLFSNPAPRRVLFKARYVLVLAMLVGLANVMRAEWLLPAILVSAVGQLIQTWCLAALVKNRELTVRGPYALVRNPMYLGRFLLILGFVLLPGSWIAVGVYVLVYYLYVVNRVAREERRLNRIYGERYREYCSKTRRFLPSPKRLFDREVWFFGWGPFVENHGPWNILVSVLAYVFLYFASSLI